MTKPQFHILVCSSFRGTEPKGVCHAKGAQGLLPYLESELADRGLDALVSSTSCLKVCDSGPALVVYPQGHWYGGVTEEGVDAILDALEAGGTADEFLL
ncbi:MAG: (2Fe-2S) ferredoxin domain-containing protein [Deltaproteobacteria bacterium]|nr:(2Fe-2S) ferredoxin domain-containing protein [Deltaproteobacteria bacterium]